MSSSNFDWCSEEDEACVAVRHQPGIAVYLNPRDEVVIRQQATTALTKTNASMSTRTTCRSWCRLS